jgi:hypothetical protein
MYNQYLKVLPAKAGSGNGVFTSIKIPAGVPVLEVTGDVFAEHELPDPNHPALLQVGPNTFIGPSGDVDDYVNHSCNPNCNLHVVGNRAILYSMYEIAEGSEITFDYSTSATDSLEKWKMDCCCGSYNCRKVISGLQHVPPDVVEELTRKNMIPLFMRVPIFMRK